MSKMAKIALVGLLATQGCSSPTEQESADKLEKELEGYHLHYSTNSFSFSPEAIESPWYVELRKVPQELRKKYEDVTIVDSELLDHPQYGSVNMLDQNKDGKVDFVAWERPLEFVRQFNGRTDNMSPKVRAVYQKTFRKHQQAAQRNYKGGKK